MVITYIRELITTHELPSKPTAGSQVRGFGILRLELMRSGFNYGVRRKVLGCPGCPSPSLGV